MEVSPKSESRRKSCPPEEMRLMDIIGEEVEKDRLGDEQVALTPGPPPGLSSTPSNAKSEGQLTVSKSTEVIPMQGSPRRLSQENISGKFCFAFAFSFFFFQ
tara:strand:- start:350 stop:655 length:306 start_codon:yes stop_codon:yes gene_type:complete